MKRFLIMDFDKWDGSFKGLTNGKKYDLIDKEGIFVDDDGDFRRTDIWDGTISCQDDNLEEEYPNDFDYLFRVKYSAAITSETIYVFANSKKQAIIKSSESVGEDFLTVECDCLVDSKRIMYAD